MLAGNNDKKTPQSVGELSLIQEKVTKTPMNTYPEVY
jgi:hypothetical protein